MKYAFVTFSCPELDLDSVLALAARLGYEGVEPRLTSRHKHGIEVDLGAEARTDIKKKVAGSGVDLACIATSCTYADPATQGENVEVTHRAIDLAADLGCRSIRVFGGKIGEGLSRQQATNLVAVSLSQVAGHAEERGVIVCMETHDDWCDPSHATEVMERVDSRAVGVNWDIMHPVRMKCDDMAGSFEKLKNWIRHVHVHDARVAEDGSYTTDLLPIGEGYVDHRTAVECLGTLSYTGYLSGEWINWSDPYDIHLPRELAVLRRYEG